VTTARSEPLAPESPADRLPRFDRCERAVHWTTAAVVIVLMATAAVLYIGQLSTLVGRRQLVRQVHVVSGLVLPLPLLLGLVGRWRLGLAADLGVLNRWNAGDRRWVWSRGRDPSVRVGKFNAGQKLNAAFMAGTGMVLLGTGSIMHWFSLFPLDWRTGATFVHDWTAIALALAVVGHVRMALGDTDALRSMVKGWVPARWAMKRRPRWYEEVTGQPADPGPTPRPRSAKAAGSGREQARR